MSMTFAKARTTRVRWNVMVKALPVSRIATLEIVYSLLITLQAPVVRRSDNVDTDWLKFRLGSSRQSGQAIL